MVSAFGMAKATNYYENTMQAKKNDLLAGVKDELPIQNSTPVQKASEVSPVKSSEDKLSAKAKKYLNELRKTYSDYDFIVADDSDDKRALVNQSTKEFSVVFSSAELEKMASDEEYAQEKLQKMQTAIDMSKRICQQFGFESAWSNGETLINKMAVYMNDDGSVSIFAELEKLSEKQRERIEAERQQRLEDSREEKKAEKKSDVQKLYEEDEETTVKRAWIEASSEEELIEQLTNFDWSKIAADVRLTGTRIDFSV
ncbi:MAG: hypothetical protein E7299_06490 [Lachnospiraceae bacterium]|nr:hypothetical protein [Lachnospiraceae bacterium]